MIESLRIEALGIVGEAELELDRGLHVLTGETGAGKSLVLGALSLLAGGRAEPDAVASGAKRARVEAVVRVDDPGELAALLAELGVETEDGCVIVERSVAAEGRSRARLGGAAVPASTLAALLGGRLEVSSQHESQALRRAEVQARLVDDFGDLAGLRGHVAARVGELRALDAEARTLREEREDRARREDFLTFQAREIDEARLEVGEMDELRGERARLGHAERLREDVGHAAARVGGDPATGEGGAAALLAEAARRLEAAAAVDASLTPIAERLRSAEIEVSDAGADLASYLEGLEADPARLGAVEGRLAELERLARKYGEGEVEILAFREGVGAELVALAGSDERLEKLAAERASLALALALDAAALSAGRARAGAALAAAVEEALHGLALQDAVFRVELEPVAAPEGLPCGPGGVEQPSFRFAANPGAEPRPLGRVASGGELSRVFLALKNVLRHADPGSTLVFDEVDAGIGGRVADRVGAVLAELARDHQVLCITHLPQVAARADVHFVVRKQDGVARVERLDEGGRVEELARMAGGEEITEATRRHARALLRQARP